MDYKYTELDYAKLIYKDGIQSENHLPTELRLVATYMRRDLNYKPKKLKAELESWAENHIAGYKKELYYKILKRAINQACKKGSKLINISSVKFYQYELDYIDSLKIINEDDTLYEYAYECKKFLFTLLFKMKVNKIISESKAQEPFDYKGKYFKGGQKKYTELKKLAKLSEKLKINEDIIYTLWKNNLITPMYNGLIKMNFMEQIYKLQDENQEVSEAVIEVKDFDSVGWYYDYYKGDPKIMFCAVCGKIFKKKSNKQLCCSDECSKENNYKPIETKTITCVDCGKEVEIDPSSRCIKCEDCRKKSLQESWKKASAKYKNKKKS